MTRRRPGAGLYCGLVSRFEALWRFVVFLDVSLVDWHHLARLVYLGHEAWRCGTGGRFVDDRQG